jgi:hypothetical protein
MKAFKMNLHLNYTYKLRYCLTKNRTHVNLQDEEFKLFIVIILETHKLW